MGVLGAGQLGRMFAEAAVRMGFLVHVYAPDADRSPAAVHASRVVQAPWSDADAVLGFGAACDAVTLEFENVPTETVDLVAGVAPVRPGHRSLQVAQRRDAEKRFLADQGLPHAAWCTIASPRDLGTARDAIPGAAILKSAGFGYDGKGQVRLDVGDDLGVAWEALGRVPAVLETRIELAEEWSVVLGRHEDGTVEAYPPIRNVHVGGILDTSVSVDALQPVSAPDMVAMARHVAEALGHVGVLCTEFFVDTGGRVWVNEIAPRPHNSGHVTIEAFDVSQFAMQVRTTAGLPLVPPQRLADGAMANLVGVAPGRGTATRASHAWHAALARPGTCVHDYGKSEVRAGRKMGHVTVVRPAGRSGSVAEEAGRSVPERVARDLVEAAHDARRTLTDGRAQA